MVTQATKSIDDCIFEARAACNDAVLPYRNLDSTLIAYLNTALRVLYSIRPDAFIGNFASGIISTQPMNTYVVADLGLNPQTPLPVDDRIFFFPLVAYIAGRIELADDEFTEQTRSAQLMASFVQQLQG